MATQIVSFADSNGTLFLNDPADFDARIICFRTGDRIQLGRLEVATSVSYDTTTDTLTI